MLTTISEALYRISRPAVALAALVIFVAFTALVLPAQSRQAEVYAGGETPDTSLFYAPADLYRMAEAYGPAGRQAYVRARLTFDVAWPIVYAFFLTTAISALARIAPPASAIWRRLNLIPLAGLLFDYLENAASSIVMARYPSLTPGIDLLAPAFTVLKWLFVGGSFLALAAALVAARRRSVDRARNP